MNFHCIVLFKVLFLIYLSASTLAQDDPKPSELNKTSRTGLTSLKGSDLKAESTFGLGHYGYLGAPGFGLAYPYPKPFPFPPVYPKPAGFPNEHLPPYPGFNLAYPNAFEGHAGLIGYNPAAYQIPHHGYPYFGR